MILGALAVPAFLAGILTFLAPCTLPLVPGYLAYIAGINSKESLGPERKHGVFFHAIFFVFGFTIVFMGFGVLAGLLGESLLPYRDVLSRVGGLFIIFLGFTILGIFKFPSFSLLGSRGLVPKGITSSFLFGSSFALGFSPCVGPVLGSILTLTLTNATALSGAILLGFFSLGLAIPFLLTALFINKANNFFTKVPLVLNTISVTGGIVLVTIGLLLLLGMIGELTNVLFSVFDFANYERILNYL